MHKEKLLLGISKEIEQMKKMLTENPTYDNAVQAYLLTERIGEALEENDAVVTTTVVERDNNKWRKKI